MLLLPLAHCRKPVLDTDRPLCSRVEPCRQADPVRRLPAITSTTMSASSSARSAPSRQPPTGAAMRADRSGGLGQPLSHRSASSQTGANCHTACTRSRIAHLLAILLEAGPQSEPRVADCDELGDPFGQRLRLNGILGLCQQALVLKCKLRNPDPPDAQNRGRGLPGEAQGFLCGTSNPTGGCGSGGDAFESVSSVWSSSATRTSTLTSKVSRWNSPCF